MKAKEKLGKSINGLLLNESITWGKRMTQMWYKHIQLQSL